MIRVHTIQMMRMDGLKYFFYGQNNASPRERTRWQPGGPTWGTFIHLSVPFFVCLRWVSQNINVVKALSGLSRIKKGVIYYVKQQISPHPTKSVQCACICIPSIHDADRHHIPLDSANEVTFCGQSGACSGLRHIHSTLHATRGSSSSSSSGGGWCDFVGLLPGSIFVCRLWRCTPHPSKRFWTSFPEDGRQTTSHFHGSSSSVRGVHFFFF